MIQYINFATPFVLFICGIIASIIAYGIKSNISDIKDSVGDLKVSIEKLDERNTQTHKELFEKNNIASERIVRIETKLNGGLK